MAAMTGLVLRSMRLNRWSWPCCASCLPCLLDEAASVCVYPQFSNDGGVDSERTFVKQLVQKYINDGSTDDLFNEDELDDEYDDDYV